MSNITYPSKIIEKYAVLNIANHIALNHLGDSLQSAYKPVHSTETVLLKVKSDLMQHLSNRQGVFLVLLDLSAAFDTVNHSVLLNRLTNDIGVGGAVLKWFESYLTGRTRVCINGTFAEPHNLQYGLPQGSMVGPLSFTIYTCPIGLIIKKYSLDYHIYADDIQLYVTFNPTDPSSINAALSRLSSCITEIQNWMTKKLLKTEPGKNWVLHCCIKSPHAKRLSSPTQSWQQVY